MLLIASQVIVLMMVAGELSRPYYVQSGRSWGRPVDLFDGVDEVEGLGERRRAIE